MISCLPEKVKGKPEVWRNIFYIEKISQRVYNAIMPTVFKFISKELTEIRNLIAENQDLIKEKWDEYFS